MSYLRKHADRAHYEIRVAEVLVAAGFEVVLSDDMEDELIGIDLWDTKYGIPMDLHHGSNCSRILEEKKKRARERGIHIMHLPATLVDSLLCAFPSTRAKAESDLVFLYQEELAKAKRRKLVTPEKVEAWKRALARNPRQSLTEVILRAA